MTNGEKFKKIFKISQVDEGELYAYVWLPNHDAAEISIEWWNAEYQEPTTKNNLGVDAVSRQAVLELIADYDLSMGQVVRGIHALPSVTPPEPRWIPVSEYLPVTNDEVLVTYIVNGNAKKRYVETANCFNGEWSSVNDEYRIPNTKIEIIAWCEMPKPYKAESEE